MRILPTHEVTVRIKWDKMFLKPMAQAQQMKTTSTGATKKNGLIL